MKIILPTGVVINDTISKIIRRHKGLIAKVYLIEKAPEKESKEGNLINYAIKTGKELALYFANFKCENCSSESELTIHHLLMRVFRNKLWFGKYEAQRRYFGNIAVFCSKCHSEVHPTVNQEDMLTIDDKRIQSIKKKFEKYLKEETMETSKKPRDSQLNT